MRRIVATLLVVASPAVLAAPVGASDGRAALPAAPAVVPGPSGSMATPAPVAAPAPAQTVALTPPPAVRVVPAPALAAPTAPAVHRPLRAVHPRAITPAAIGDAAYAQQLQADLCRARTIFCGLDHTGRYPGR